ncbi:Rne/Rng family ribonuclease [Pelagimonas varians]|uniref:Ribonuclease E n=1 Tax=Pelagimonas varians TaxID=696760 RepID=A0A238JUW7_9RHOB|nr:ribonuclease E/G [Pelagimonas varians]PYG34469.1 RNAse E [Pelagimonas varians]SMX33974.1 Ribonuclease E [Pelagimonas varians]
MAKKMLIDATHAEETRVVVVDGNKVEEFDFESENKRQLAGNIYLAKVTRVEPSLQAAFVDYGGNRHGFLAFSEIHPDYYQIPIADRKALMEEEAALAAAAAEEDDERDKPKRSRTRTRRKPKTADVQADAKPDTAPEVKAADGAVDAAAPNKAPDAPREISGMETIDLNDGDDSEAGAPGEGLSPMETVHEQLIAEPIDSVEDVQPETETAPADVVESAEAEVVPAADAAEDVPAEAGEAETIAAEAVEVPAVSDEVETEAEKPQRPMAADSEDKPVVVSADPSEVTDAPDEAAAPVAEEAAAPVAEDAAAPVVEEAAAPVVEEAAAPVAEDAAAPVVEEAAAPVVEDVAVDAQDDTETPEAPAQKAKASERDSSIESVADDDSEEDIRPRRKPRPRRYKIQEVIKVRQIMLVQVVKEERGNKGAALTTYLSLAGRYCVLMPNTARGGGISRKITNAVDRSKLKSIANEIDVPTGAGLIIRTAGAKRTKTEIKRDYEYLQRLWEQIRELTLKSSAPAKIYEEGDLIKRSIRDLYNREIDEVFVEGERGYRIAKDFMKMIMPSHAKNVKNYNESIPLFARYQVESYLGGMFNPTVQLKSGGYIVIGITEALVAIDVNSGRSTREGSIEDTATKTNLEAAEEVARQLRLRDLAGLIVIDFIDMDERKNNAAVEKRIKDKLKTDRARIQVGRISGFGLMEMSRQRLRPGMIEATTQPCPACHGTGLIRSDDNMALQVLRQIEEEGVRRRSREVLVKCPVSIANYLMNQKREHIAQIESRYGMSVRIEGDPHLVAPDFTVEKFKTATRVVPVAAAPVVSVDTSLMDLIDEETEAEEVEIEEAEIVEEPQEAKEKPEAVETGEDGQPKKRRRRRRRKPSKSREEGTEGVEADKVEGAAEKAGEAKAETSSDAPEAPAETVDGEEKPKKRRSRRSRSRKKPADAAAEGVETPTAEATPVDAAPAEAAPADTAAPVADTAIADAPVVEAPVVEAPVAETPVVEAPAAEVAVVEATAVEAKPDAAEQAAPVAETPAPEPAVDAAPEESAAAPAEQPAEAVAEETKPKRARTRRKASDVIASVGVAVDAPVNGETLVAEEPAAAVAAPEAAETATPEPETAPDSDKPKRRGWWSLGS